MGMAVFVQQSDPRLSDAYRRQARRLRCRWADHPVRRQRALADLAREVDAVAPSAELPEHALRRPDVARRFAMEIRPELSAGPLRYSQRCQLLKRARSLGIERFEANLIIAAVQYHQTARPPEAPARSMSTLRAVWIALAIELILLLAAACIWL